MKRRTATKALGAAGLVSIGVPTVSAERDSLIQQIRDHGWYAINTAGTKPQIDHFYRADHPLRKELDGGGVVQVHPKDGGIYCRNGLSEEDAIAGAGFSLGTWSIGSIEEIKVTTNGNPVSVGLWLGEGDFFEWEPVRGGLERLVDLDGDILTGGVLVDGDSITKTSHSFGGKTLAEWADEEGHSKLARFSVGVFGSRSADVTVTSFSVEETSGEKRRR